MKGGTLVTGWRVGMLRPPRQNPDRRNAVQSSREAETLGAFMAAFAEISGLGSGLIPRAAAEINHAVMQGGVELEPLRRLRWAAVSASIRRLSTLHCEM